MTGQGAVAVRSFASCVTLLGTPPRVSPGVQDDQARSLLARHARDFSSRLPDLDPLVDGAVEARVGDHVFEKGLRVSLCSSLPLRIRSLRRHDVHGNEAKPRSVRQLGRGAKGVRVTLAVDQADDGSHGTSRSAVTTCSLGQEGGACHRCWSPTADG